MMQGRNAGCASARNRGINLRRSRVYRQIPRSAPRFPSKFGISCYNPPTHSKNSPEFAL